MNVFHTSRMTYDRDYIEYSAAGKLTIEFKTPRVVRETKYIRF